MDILVSRQPIEAIPEIILDENIVKSSMDILVSRQPVEARDEVENMGKLGQLDACHGEEVSKPRR